MHFLEKLWYKPRYRWLALPLLPLSLLFEWLAKRRRFKLKKTAQKHSVPVVIIGNITVGGTGKTPVIIALTRFLMNQGIKVGVISRGYKSQAARKKVAMIVNDEVTPIEVGDEPYLIYRETLCPLVVHPDRNLALATLLQHFNVDVVLSDDGLQHYALARDIEIAVMDGVRQLGNGFCLPAGPLREPASRLNEVDFVLVNQTEVAADFGKTFHFQVRPEHLIKVDGSRAVVPLTYLQALSCYAVAGIAHPERFFATLKTLGADITPKIFKDHHQFTKKDFAELNNLPIVMTQKDAVKCENLSLSNAYALEIGVALPKEFLRAFLGKLGYNQALAVDL